jgi:hypothetical protein
MTKQQTKVSNLGPDGTKAFLADADAFYKSYFSGK